MSSILFYIPYFNVWNKSKYTYNTKREKNFSTFNNSLRENSENPICQCSRQRSYLHFAPAYPTNNVSITFKKKIFTIISLTQAQKAIL